MVSLKEFVIHTCFINVYNIIKNKKNYKSLYIAWYATKSSSSVPSVNPIVLDSDGTNITDPLFKSTDGILLNSATAFP